MLNYMIAGAASAIALTVFVPSFATEPVSDTATVILPDGEVKSVSVDRALEPQDDAIAFSEVSPDKTLALLDRSAAYQDLVRIHRLEAVEERKDADPSILASRTPSGTTHGDM